MVLLHQGGAAEHGGLHFLGRESRFVHEVAAAATDFAVSEAWQIAEIGVHAEIGYHELCAHGMCDRVDRCTPTYIVAAHLGRDGSRVRAHTSRGDPVIARQHEDDRTGEAWGWVAVNQCQTQGQALEFPEAAGGLG